MNRLPIRVKLTIAFGLAMLVMLAGAALFVYLRLRADLDDRIDASLQARIDALIAAQGESSLAGVALEDPEETFAQLLSPDGQVLGTVGTLRGPALSPSESRQAVDEPVVVERDLPGVDGRTRVLAQRHHHEEITVVGQSLNDRDDALANVVTSFATGGLVAIVLASIVGYLLATAGMSPVEAMRRRASEVSLLAGDPGLPLPAANDEIRRLGETLNEMLERLRAAFERESRFVADASHELRTPIAIIKTELEGALQSADPKSSVHAALVAAVEECDRLAHLTEDLLVMARTADGHLAIRPELVDLSDLMDGVRHRFVERALRRGRVIRLQVEPAVEVLADPIRIRQALANLVENALRHGQGEIVLAARKSASGVEIDVSDEGPGFPEDLVVRAFERFARGDRARSSEGFGLGLAIVQAIVETHGGSATVVGTTPTTMRICLPDAT